MEFLSPLYLLAAGAAAIPLLIHLMRRRIGTRVEFPAVRYLARAEREHSRNLRLRNLLLMLLRVAAVLLVAAAAARPVAQVVGAGHAPTALAIIFDNSLSTSAVSGGHPVLDQLRAQARTALDRAVSSDRVWLITADGTVRGGTRDAVRDAIDHTEALASAGRPDRALIQGSALVAAAPMSARELLVLTDAQATTWVEQVSAGNADVIVWHPASPPPVNHAVVEATAVPARWTPRGAVHTRILTPDSATYRIALSGRTLARGTAARDEEVVVRVAPPERGWTPGLVEIEPDELRGDDRRWFAAWIGPAPAVNALASAGEFPHTALDALVQAERAVPGNDIVLTSADEATRLPALLIAPSDPVRIGAANRALERLGVPWRLGAVRHGTAAVRPVGNETRALEGVTASTRTALRLAEPAATDTLALAGGEPWIVAGQSYVLVASPLEPTATTLPVRAVFVPWLDDVVSQRLGPNAGPVISAVPRQQILRPPGTDQLEQPNGARVPIASDTVAAPDRAGVYFFLRGTSRAGALLVNPEPAESQLRRLDDATMARRIRGHSVHVASDSAQFARALFASSPRRPLLVPLLILAMAAIAAESAAARTRRAPTRG